MSLIMKTTVTVRENKRSIDLITLFMKRIVDSNSQKSKIEESEVLMYAAFIYVEIEVIFMTDEFSFLMGCIVKEDIYTLL